MEQETIAAVGGTAGVIASLWGSWRVFKQIRLYLSNVNQHKSKDKDRDAQQREREVERLTTDLRVKSEEHATLLRSYTAAVAESTEWRFKSEAAARDSQRESERREEAAAEHAKEVSLLQEELARCREEVAEIRARDVEVLREVMLRTLAERNST